MRWIGNYLLELARGPWPKMIFIRHGHGIHQIAYDMVERKQAKSSREALEIDIPNYLIPLSPLGRWQAMETGRLFDINPDCVYASLIGRTYETARLIFPNHDIRADARLNEKDFGPAHMMGSEELQKYFPAHYNRYLRDGKYFSTKAPGGENYIDLLVRLHSMLDTFRRDWPGKTIAIVGHSAAMLSIRQLFEHYGPDELISLGRTEWIQNCGILHYTWPSEFWGWRRGKFRIRLKHPPYKLWEVTKNQEEEFEKQAWEEIAVLRDKYKNWKAVEK